MDKLGMPRLRCEPVVFLHAGDECFGRYHRKLASGDWQAPARRKRRKGDEKDERVNNKRPTGRNN